MSSTSLFWLSRRLRYHWIALFWRLNCQARCVLTGSPSGALRRWLLMVQVHGHRWSSRRGVGVGFGGWGEDIWSFAIWGPRWCCKLIIHHTVQWQYFWCIRLRSDATRVMKPDHWVRFWGGEPTTSAEYEVAGLPHHHSWCKTAFLCRAWYWTDQIRQDPCASLWNSG